MQWGLGVAEVCLYEALDLVPWHEGEVVKDMEVGGETGDAIGLEEVEWTIRTLRRVADEERWFVQFGVFGEKGGGAAVGDNMNGTINEDGGGPDEYGVGVYALIRIGPCKEKFIPWSGIRLDVFQGEANGGVVEESKNSLTEEGVLNRDVVDA